jgi:hypothetical protein
MIRTIRILLVASAGAMVPILLLCIARMCAPMPIENSDSIDALRAALLEPLKVRRTATRGATYVRVEEEALLTQLRADNPGVSLQSWAERPADDGCKRKDEHWIVMGPCGRDDYISAQVLAFPLWRCALVAISTFNSGSLLILIKIGTRVRWQR